jgi:high-affinity Fe2+/Pb2+ permease
VEVHPETGRPESEHERVDRNLAELLGELRVALPGVQVLFAFLLVVPFNQRFVEVTDFQEKVYFVTLLCTAVASACLIAPSVHHRIEFRRQDKEHIVLVSNRLSVVGLSFLAVAMTGATMLVTDVLFGAITTILATAAVAVVFAVLWYALPLRRLARGAPPRSQETRTGR